jgi:hypothetical protein
MDGDKGPIALELSAKDYASISSAFVSGAELLEENSPGIGEVGKPIV